MQPNHPPSILLYCLFLIPPIYNLHPHSHILMPSMKSHPRLIHYWPALTEHTQALPTPLIDNHCYFRQPPSLRPTPHSIPHPHHNLHSHPKFQSSSPHLLGLFPSHPYHHSRHHRR